MRELAVVGLSEDRQFLMVRDPSTKQELRVRVTDDLASQLAGRATTSAVPDIATGSERPMDSILTPREIQTRIRAGQSPRDLADESSMSLEKIEAFAGPVLAEREYIAQQARRTTVRRKHAAGSAEPLEDLVTTGLANRGSDAANARWDAAQRTDGLWTITVTTDEESHRFVFDTAGRFVRAADDSAHDLIGDVALPDSADMALADAVRQTGANQNPSSTDQPSPEELPVGQSPAGSSTGSTGSDRPDDVAPAARASTTTHVGDELELELNLTPSANPIGSDLAQSDQDQSEDHLSQNSASGQLGFGAVSSLKDARDRRAQAALASQDRQSAASAVDSSARTPTDDHDQSQTDSAADTQTGSERPKKRHERRRVPSWDEIMFGGKEH